MNWNLDIGWQECVVILLVVLCILRMGFSIRTFIKGMKKNNNPCSSCISGCELKNQLDKKKQSCQINQSAGKKKCCG